MLETYRTLYRVYLAWALQYRVMIALWATAGLVQAFVGLAIWSAVAKSGALPPSWDATAFAAYFLAVMVVDEFTHTWIYWIWEWRVRQGTFAAMLLRPSHPIHGDIADNLAVKTVSMSVKVPIAIAVGWAYGVHLHVTPVRFAAFILSMLLAYALRTMIEPCIACVAFWLTRMQAVAGAWFLTWSFLSGQFAPVELLPQPLRTVAEVLPFHWALAFPVDVALGHVDGAATATGLLAQACWVAITWLVFHILWRTAQSRFTAVGT